MSAASPLPIGLVFGEIIAERARQVSKGYTDEHDDAHSLDELADVADTLLSDDEPLTRDRLVQAATVLVSAILSHDRRAAQGDGS